MIYTENQINILNECIILTEESIKEKVQKHFRASMMDPEIFKEKFEKLKKNNDVKGVKKLLYSYSISVNDAEISKYLVKQIKENLPKIKKEFLRAVDYVKKYEPDYDYKKVVLQGRLTYGALFLGGTALSGALGRKAGAMTAAALI